MGKKEDAPDYFWYQSLRVLLEAVGDWSPWWNFWAPIVGGSQGQELIKTEDFCAMGEPFFSDWSMESLISNGTEESLDAWARREMYRKYCDTSGGGT